MKLAELNIGQAAFASGVSAHIIADAVDAGYLPAVLRDDGGYYIARTDLEPFLARHRASIDDSKFNAADIFLTRASSANRKTSPVNPQSEHGLLALAKQRAAAAGQPHIEQQGKGFVAHVQQRVTMEAQRRSRS